MMKKLVCLFFALLVFNSFSQTTYFLRAGGTITNAGDWGDDATGTNNPPADFTGQNDWVITNNASVVLSSSWDVDGGNVTVGDGSTATQLELASGSNITSLGTGFYIDNNGSVKVTSNFPFNSTKLRPLTGSSFFFESGSISVPAIASGHSYYNLTIRNSIFINATALTVSNLLTIDPTFELDLNGTALTVATIAGTGILKGDASGGAANINVNGTGGTFTFKSGFRILGGLTVNLASGSSVATLGSDLRINGGLALTNGKLDLAGFDFTVNSGTSTFGSGVIVGNSSSDMRFLGTTGSSISGSMLMDATSNNLNSLTLNRSGLTLTLGNSLNILDSVQVQAGTLATGGNLTLKATSTKKARVGRISGTLSGNITIETYVPGPNTGWANLGSPGVGAINLSQWDTYYSSGATNGLPITCNNCTYGPEFFTPRFHSIQQWNETTESYDTLLNTLGNRPDLADGRGYWVYVGTANPTTNDILLVSTGAPNVGGKSISVTKSAVSTYPGYNLIANPYPSPISWTKVSSANPNLSSTYYAYSADGGGTQGAYVAGVGGVNGLTDVIPSGQGFYVQVTTATANVTFAELHKTNVNTTSVFRPGYLVNSMKLNITGATSTDECMIWTGSGPTPFFDKDYDARKIFQTAGYAGYADNFYSQYTTISTKDANNEDYAIMGMPQLYDDLKIPVLARVDATGSFTISSENAEQFGNCTFLRDKLLNVVHDLRSGPYVCTIADTTQAPRFELLVCKTFASPGTGINEDIRSDNAVMITQETGGALVTTNFESDSHAVISVYNILGAKIMSDIPVNGTKTSTHLNIDPNQVVFVKVTTDNNSYVKKFYAN